MIQEIDKEQQLADLILNSSPFWIRLYNLPFGYRSDERLKIIAKAIGDVMEIEEDFLDVNPFRRVRIWLDVTKISKRFQQIWLKNQQTV